MKHRNLFTAAKMALVVGAITILGVSQTHALDGHVYTGSSCVPFGTNRYPGYNFSAIYNPSASQWLYLDCPAEHDSINNTISSGWVRVIDLHYSSDVTCSLNSFYFSGGSAWGWWTPERSSAGSSSNTQHLSFGGVGSNSLAHYYYGCRIPPTYNGNASSITSYFVNENE